MTDQRYLVVVSNHVYTRVLADNITRQSARTLTRAYNREAARLEKVSRAKMLPSVRRMDTASA